MQGFFKGVGLGIMGVALKPVMGVTDGLTSVVRYAQLIYLLITFFLLVEKFWKCLNSLFINKI